jgi:aryl-alcohol dehydrogenase-like predicted oxidoreductase
MKYKVLGKTGFEVSVLSFGSWAIGGTWGTVKDEESLAALNKAIDMGVNFIDTADVYGDGHSEMLIGKVLKSRSEKIYVATKLGRRLNPHNAAGYNKSNLTGFVDSSLKNLGVESIDLIQLHCPPTEVYYNPEVFAIMDDFVKQGKIKNYGVSVEKVEEALKAIEYPNVKTVQIIFNMFRHRPSELFFEQAKKRNIGIIARVPLASGMLSGKMTQKTTFEKDDHRFFNRHGEAFDKGETFSGVDYETGLKAVEELKKLLPEGFTLSQMALRWILMFDEVTCAIPGAKRTSQVEENFIVADFPPIPEKTMSEIKSIYEKYIKNPVHYMW